MIVSDDRTPAVSSMIPGILGMLRRRRIMLIVPTLAGLGIGFSGYATAPRSYVSEAVLAFDLRRVHATPNEPVISPLPQENPVLRTELDIISSRMMASKVVAHLEGNGVAILQDDNGGFRVSDLLRAILFGNSAAAAIDESARIANLSERAKIDALLSNLRVSNDGRSYTIYINYRASDPHYAAEVANAFGNAYLDHHIDVQKAKTRLVGDWLEETLIKLRASLETSEKALENFRQRAGLAQTRGLSLQAQRVVGIDAELASARAALAGAQARLNTVREIVENDRLPALAEILNSATVQALRTEQIGLERRLEGLRQRGALKSSEIASIDSELSSLNDQIAVEVGRVIDSLSNELEIARNKQASLERSLAQASEELSAVNHAEVEAAQLEREANANRTIYESYLVRYKQTIEQDGMAVPEAQVISYAEPANTRAAPRLSTWLLFGLGIGGGVAIGGAVLREATDGRPRLPRQLEEEAGLPVLGYVPRLSFGKRRRMAADAQDASTSFGRALGVLRAVLHIPPRGGGAMTISVVSASDGEGKTTLTIGLARSAAAAGLKVIVIDANLRRPMVARMFGKRPTGFLDQVMDPQNNLNGLIDLDTASGVHFVAARQGAARPELLLTSDRFRWLVGKLKANFDLVLIDTPGLDAAADALQICAGTDKTLLVADFGSTRVERVIGSLRALTAGAYRPVGVVLNFVDQQSFPAISGSIPVREGPQHAAGIS